MSCVVVVAAHRCCQRQWDSINCNRVQITHVRVSFFIMFLLSSSSVFFFLFRFSQLRKLWLIFIDAAAWEVHPFINGCVGCMKSRTWRFVWKLCRWRILQETLFFSQSEFDARQRRHSSFDWEKRRDVIRKYVLDERTVITFGGCARQSVTDARAPISLENVNCLRLSARLSSPFFFAHTPAS